MSKHYRRIDGLYMTIVNHGPNYQVSADIGGKIFSTLPKAGSVDEAVQSFVDYIAKGKAEKPKPKLEINSELVLSTAHISESTNAALTNDLLTQRTDCGLRLHVLGFIEYGAPEELKALLKLAKQNNCKWLLLDRDGDIHPSLPVFDW
jgi:hypothetical protein